MARLARSESKREKALQHSPRSDENGGQVTDSFASTDQSVEDDSLEDEQDSLIRLSEQARRRPYYAQGNVFADSPGSGDNIDIDVNVEDDDYEEGAEEEDDDDEDEDEDIDQDDEGEDVETIDREHDHFEDHEMEGDDDGTFLRNDFLRNILQARFGGQPVSRSNDPRLEFFRAMEAFAGQGRRRGNHENGDDNSNEDDNDEDEDEDDDEQHGFADVVLRLMGGGMAFGGMGRESTELMALIDNLQQGNDSYIILETLNELSGRLLMMNAPTAERVVPASKLAKSLVAIMSDPLLAEELELQLVACRCLYNFLEVSLEFVHDALKHDAVSVLCSKLVEITYIDLTEQALQTLEMISRDPIAHNRIVSCGGLVACLQYLDFLTTHAQRKSLTVVSNACTSVSIKNLHRVEEAFESLTNVITNHSDPIVVENCWLAISRIIHSFKLHPEALDKLFLLRPSLLQKMVQIIQNSTNKSTRSSSGESSNISLKYNTCLMLIKSLIILASVSLEVSKILICKCAIGEVIVKSLSEVPKGRQSSVSTRTRPKLETESDFEIEPSDNSIPLDALMSAPKELLFDFLDLIGYLTPVQYTISESAFISDHTDDFEEKKALNEARATLYAGDISIDVSKFVKQIWPLLVKAFQAEVDFEIRKKVFIIIHRIVCFLSFDDLKETISPKLLAVMLATIASQTSRVLLVRTNAQNGDTNTQDSSNSTKSASNPRTDGNQIAIGNYQLLLTAFLTAKRVTLDADLRYLKEFEREGLIAETESILFLLERLEVINIYEEKPLTKPLPASDYTNKFLDRELLKELTLRPVADVLTNVLKYGTQFHETYVQAKNSSRNITDVKENDLISEVKRIIQQLKTNLDTTQETWLSFWNQVKMLFDGTNYETSITSFELASSGIIDELLYFLDTENLRKCPIECREAFLSVFNNQNTPIRFLVQRLQDSLNRSESFELNVPSVATMTRLIGFSTENKFTSAMSRQIKLKVAAADSDVHDNEVIANLNSMIISVHAIATFKSIANFLELRFSIFRSIADLREDENSQSLDVKETKESRKKEIEFLVDNEVVPMEMSIYGAIYRSFQNFPDQVIESSAIWSSTHTINVRIVEREHSKTTPSIVQIIQNQSFKESDHENKVTISILNSLRYLYKINQMAKATLNFSAVAEEEFINWKITAKVSRQLEEPLVVASGTLPGWCIETVKRYSFLFPLETRISFLQSTSFGYSRLIHTWQERLERSQEDSNANALGTRLQLGHPSRYKVRISRKLILQSALKVLNMYGATPGILEIEYFDEVGSGMGPTLEFYASVSTEFAKKKLKMWRDEALQDIDDNQYVNNSQGLFPVPLSSSQIATSNGQKIIYLFGILGKLIARALLDSRIVDFNFNPIFWRLLQLRIVDNEQAMDFADLKAVDSRLAASLDHLTKYLASDDDHVHSSKEKVYDGCTISDLSLVFSLPGYPEYELIKNGLSIPVTQNNLEDYISKVKEATLGSGIRKQLEAFMEGFSSVFPIEALSIFLPVEIVELLGSAEEDWSLETLRSALKANHGYNTDSISVEQLLHIMNTFTLKERREFLQFITGSPKLPIGGFKALKPEFTVVRKLPEDNLSSDDYLPSVMTCANYLKLPEYSSPELMRKRLLQAVREGAGEFHLS